MSKKVRCYHTTREVIDTVKNEKHTILVYGELKQTNFEKGFVLAPITYAKRNHNDIKTIDDKFVVLSRNHDLRPTRQFNFGWAICSGNDKFDLETGIKIAKKRFSDSPMTTTDVRFFSDDMIHSILKNELNFIEKNLEEKYLPDDFKVTVDNETNSQNNMNGCDGECETCPQENCASRTQNDSFDVEVEIEPETDENQNVEYEAHISKNQNHLKRGQFIKFTNGNTFMYGVVRDNGITDNSKSPYVKLYWKLTKLKDGWRFGTNETIDTDEIQFLMPKYYEDDLIYKTLYEVFGIIWDSKSNRVILNSCF